MDKPSIVSSKILTEQTDWNDRLATLYIRDYHNFFRRRYLKLRAEAMEKGIEIPEIRLQSRKVEEVIPEPWLHEVDGKPPYDANYAAEMPDETQSIKEDSSRVKFMAMLMRKAAWVKGRGAVSASIAKQEAMDQLKAAKSKLPKQYKKTAVFEKELLEILPLGSRDGLLEDHQEELENVAETEIFEEQRPMKSDLLINNSHHSVVGDLRPMADDGVVVHSNRYPGHTSLAWTRNDTRTIGIISVYSTPWDGLT